ncbi:hypothetical protein [Pontibacter actiniarum]|uniref:Uncharacterized protein n=1 Tax=Pontibacter actiniarum TaxID=323450 RepID=A0A1X9YP19_9BACT|nr:hypothetical protein [Pontibacter actiniarum]ARS34594.1 hypothetical protein CA264_03560 [Pontibacter actiniarum]
MTKREQYKLTFNKIKNRVYCGQSEITTESYFLCSLLNQLSDREPEYLLDEIKLAVAGQDFDAFYSVDGALFSDGVHIQPPNAIINEKYEVKLVDLKQLLDEWIAFVRAS